MQIHINSQPKNFSGVEELADQQLKRLEKFSDRIEKADIFYRETKDPKNSHRVEIKLAIPGPDAFAHDEAETFSKAFSNCVDKLEQQLKKRRAYHHDRK